MSTSGDNLSINDTNNFKGDVNSDGKITDDDRELLNKWLTRSIGKNDLDLKNADVNYDGKVNTQDLVELSRLCKKTTSEQSIDVDSEALSEINTEDNAYKLSVDISAAGDAQALLSADESRYSSAIKSDMVVGVVPELEYEEGYAVDEVTLNFNIKDDYIENTDGEYAAVSEDFKGIKRYNVFKYFEDIDMLLPIETNYTEDNTITTTVDELGTYCLVDMEKWFETLGIKPEELANANTAPSSVSMVGTSETTAVESRSANTVGTAGIPVDQPIINSVASTAVTEPGPLDVIIQVYVKGTSISLRNAQNDVLNTANKLFDEYGENGTLRVYVANYNGTLGIVNKKNYATSKEEAEVLASNLPNCTTTEPPNFFDCVTSLVENYNNLDSKRPDTDTYHVFVDRSGIDINDPHGKAQSFIENTIKKVFVTNNPDNKALADSINGYYRESASGYGDDVSKYIIDTHGTGNKGDDDKFDYPIITATGWKWIELDKQITPVYKEIAEDIEKPNRPVNMDILKTMYDDYDDDGLLDLQEIRYEINVPFGKNISITWDEKENIVLPTLEQVMQTKAGASYIGDSIKGLPLECFGNFRILPIYSNPAEKDTDGDEFEDGEETLAERMKFSSVTIDDHLLDDSGSIDGNNPTITQDDLDKMHINEDSYTTQVSSEDKNSPLKNELKFTRTRKKGISDAKFTLTPSRNSDFAITITGTEELNLGEGATADNYNSTVRVFYKKGFIKKEKRQVEPVEIRLSNYGKNITYVFPLEASTEYSIKVNNPTNEHEGEYDIYVSEDNWVYAPFGGYREYSNTAYTESRFAYSFREDYMQDEVVFDLFKKKLGAPDEDGFRWTDETIEEHYPTVEKFFTNRNAKTEQECLQACRNELNSFGTDFVYQALNSGIEKQNEIVDVLSNADTGLGYFTMIVDDMPVLGIISNALSISVDLYSLYQGNQKEQLTNAIIDGRFNIVLYSNYQPSTSYFQKNGYKAWKTKYFYKYETIPYGQYNVQYVRCEYTKYNKVFLFENEE